MGHTHYFRVQDEARLAEVLPLIVADAKKIVANVEVPVGDAYGDKGSRPRLDEKGISLNGLEEDAAEDFTFPPVDGWTFCKTYQRPYDLVVTAILRRVQHHAGDAVDVTSDGFMSPDVYPSNYRPGFYTMEQVAENYERDWAPADRVVEHLFADSKEVSQPA